ncbi:MAG: RNase H-like domain-containing protein, partial [Limnohabitans sp.]
MKAFNELKSALISEPVVAYPRKDRPYSLIVDAATGNETQEGGLGSILVQMSPDGNYNVISYASRALVKHEKNYTPFLLEMTAAVWAMGHFDTYLRGRKFTLYTDHRPLENLATVHKKTLNRLQEAMLDYDFIIRYKSGKEMPADYLSRNVLASIDVFTPDLPRFQDQDEFISAVKKYMLTQQLPRDGAKAAHVRRVAPECFLEDGIVWRRLTRYDAQPRTVLMVPAVLAAQLVQEAHGQLLTGHDGIFKTKERLLQSYYWPNMDADVIQHINGCQRCQSRRSDDRPQPHLLTPLPLCSEPNMRVHVDLYGALQTSESGKKFVLVMTDAFTKYAELVAVPNKEAATVSLAIFNRWICRFGCPLEIVSDGGKEFVNKMSLELYKLLDIKHSKTTAYHPQTNSQVERFNQTVGKYLASFCNSSTLDWELYLAPLAFSYNTSLHRTTKATPFSLTHGLEARQPSFPTPDIQRRYGESQPSEWHQRLMQARQLASQHAFQASERTETDFNKKAKTFQYKVGQLIWLKEENFLGKNRKLAQKWTGPYQILKIFDFGVVDIEFKNKVYRVNMNRIKPFTPERTIPTTQVQQQQQQSDRPSQQQQQSDEHSQEENEVRRTLEERWPARRES